MAKGIGYRFKHMNRLVSDFRTDAIARENSKVEEHAQILYVLTLSRKTVRSAGTKAFHATRAFRCVAKAISLEHRGPIVLGEHRVSRLQRLLMPTAHRRLEGRLRAWHEFQKLPGS